MSNLNEQLKSMDPKQLAIIGLCVMVPVLLIAGFIFSGSEDPDELEGQSLETPENRDHVENYESKLDAYGAPDESEEVSLEFNLDDFKNDEMDEEAQLEREIDSMLNENKRPESAPVRRSNRSSSTTVQRSGQPTGRAVSRPAHNATEPSIDAAFDDFFSSKPKSETKQLSHTDALVYAVIHGDHTITQGERVKLRLTRTAKIANSMYESNSYIYAFPTFQNNRVLLDIRSINHVPVHLSAYDTEDSGIGLYVKGAKMVGEITNESSKETVDDLDVKGTVGQTIKKVFQKRQQTPTVTLLNNTKLILKPNKS